MKRIALAVLAVCATASTGSELSYHGSTPEWFFSGGFYRGTWFHLGDFTPGATEFSIEWAEAWLYPTDSPVYLEIWNGGVSGELLAQEELTGSVVWFSEPVITGPDFWCVLSSIEPVTVLADGSPDGHSFFSDDFVVWEQFDLGEFFISVGNETESLNTTSWGTIKHTF